MTAEIPMPPDGPDDEARHYSEEEVGRILKHATELQQADEAGGPGGDEDDGMTLATLQEVAAEAGIEPRYIRLAAARVDSPEASGIGTALAGTPLAIRAERVIPGNLPEEDYERIVGEIESATRADGNWTAIGRTLTWRDHHGFFEVTVVSRNSETRIRAKHKLYGWAGILFGLGVGLVGIGIGTMGVAFGMGVLGSPLFAALFPIGITGGLYVAMRRAMKSMGRARRAQMEGLADRLADRIAQCVRQ